MYLHHFKKVIPPYKIIQAEVLDWLAHLYSKSQTEQKYTQEDYKKLLDRVGCSAEQIDSRYSFLPDFKSTDSKNNVIFNYKSKKGEGALLRNFFFQKAAENIFAEIYENRSFSDDIIHVSCTGYLSPSAAQIKAIESEKKITVTHSYHMGCYGAFPAIRMASGFLSASDILGKKNSIDIVHTELCSLHLNPEDPSLEQMVIQSLFADGGVAYRLQNEKPASGFKLNSVREVHIPGSINAMSWVVSDWGMKMVLSKDVPKIVSQHIEHELNHWLEGEGFSLEQMREQAIFAIHPGGPKIIQQVADILKLRPEQSTHARQILKSRGNMSSATLPHVWELIADDPQVLPGTPIVSLAFGPGLTICLGMMTKL